MMTKDVNHGGDRIILIRKVWSGKEPLQEHSNSPGLGAKFRHVATKFPHISHSDDHDEVEKADEHAKLLLLTSKSLALLDPQHNSKKAHPVHYSVPLHHCNQEIVIYGSEVVIEYHTSALPSDVPVTKGFGVAKVFGILSPLSYLPKKSGRLAPSKNEDTESIHEEEDGTIVLRTRLNTASPEDAKDIAESISNAIMRLNSSMEFLDYGFPFPPMVPIVEQIRLGKNRILGDMPEVHERIVVEGWEDDQEVGFVVSSPMGTCVKTIPLAELEKACGVTKVVRAHPRCGKDEDATFQSTYAVDLRYSVEKLPDVHRQSIRDSFPRIEVLLSLVVVVIIVLAEYMGISRNSMIGLMVLSLWGGMRMVHRTRAVKRYALWYTSVQIVEVKSTVAADHRLQKGVSLRRCITLRQSMVHGRKGVVLSDETTLSSSQMNVTPEELLRLQEMSEISPAINVDLFMRYIKACRGDRELALQRLYDTAEWRQVNHVDTILDSPMPYFTELKKNYVHSVIGRSKNGLPVVVEGMGGFRQTMVGLRGNGIIPQHKGEVMRQFTFVIEWITRVLEPTDFPRGQFIRIYDMKGIHLSDIGDHEAVQLGKDMMEVLELYYPERMAKAYVINCPRFFAALWSVAKPLLDPQTANKIKLISKFKNILPALQEDIDDDVIPKAYGGNGIDNWYDSKEEKDIFALATGLNQGGQTVVSSDSKEEQQATKKEN